MEILPAKYRNAIGVISYRYSTYNPIRNGAAKVVDSSFNPKNEDAYMDWNAIGQLIRDRVTVLGMQILGALVLYFVGRWLIAIVVGAVQRALSKQKIEPTVLRFTGNTISVALNITLVVAILGYF